MSDPQSLVRQGAAQVAAGRVSEAMASFQAALALQPDHSEALGQAAILASHTGDADEARRLAERALAVDPAEPNALRATAEADFAQGRLAEAEARLRIWLKTPDLAAGPRHHAMGLLGEVLDRQDRPALAFQAWTAGNRAFRDLHRPRFELPGRQRLTAQIGGLTQRFDTASRGGWPDGPAPDRTPRRHVFLLSFMRSGTTLLEQMLAAHPDVVALEEYEALAAAAIAFMGERPDFEGLKALDAAGIERLRAAYWAEVAGQGLDPAGKVFVDKQPFNTLKLPIIQRLFPDALIIFAQRDPRDVVLSCFQHRLKISVYSYEMLDLTNTAALYDAVMGFWALARERLPLDVYVHRHEAFIQDPKTAIAALAQRLDLDPAGIGDPGERARRGLTASQSARQVMAGVNLGGLERWRRFKDLEKVEPILRPWIEAFGYPTS
ncbi:tetratricopeptide (TPR) repeat protein [Caulobacter ginsengisoli]|uniref:Tetratricopeptide (TPR) repeat protein n=1 Tax=Caulobacter ginsengisoli TaxID=400775 RepID=A0ABU0IN68_9CAUL|nr:sulfotransferase [Caulobacter ginsengisoli]MDQ0463463.1 tetratricopeptide (TPR) repeat protein [Caulobacter ginsengisoli]